MSALPPIFCESEEWRVIAAFPAYSVSSLGRVRRTAPSIGHGGCVRPLKDEIKQRALPLGHRQVTLSINNKATTILVHRLVADAFLPAPAADRDCVCHRDDNPANNRPANLFWGNRLDNSNDKVSKGRQAKGSGVAGAKLTAEAVREIRQRVRSGEKQRDIAAAYGIAQSNVSLIASGATWGHVQ